ncbi:MAG: hypothetical protein PVJ76_09950, partial [Gemmatimonadota bacterium]
MAFSSFTRLSYQTRYSLVAMGPVGRDSQPEELARIHRQARVDPLPLQGLVKLFGVGPTAMDASCSGPQRRIPSSRSTFPRVETNRSASSRVNTSGG